MHIYTFCRSLENGNSRAFSRACDIVYRSLARVRVVGGFISGLLLLCTGTNAYGLFVQHVYFIALE